MRVIWVLCSTEHLIFLSGSLLLSFPSLPCSFPFIAPTLGNVRLGRQIMWAQLRLGQTEAAEFNKA